MSGPPPRYILDWAVEPGPRKLLAQARSRAEGQKLGQGGKLDVGLSPAERRQVGRLLDARWAESGDSVPVRALRAGLVEHETTLEELLVAVGGPLVDRPAQRREKDARREAQAQEACAVLRALLSGEHPGWPATEFVEDAGLSEALRRLVLRRNPTVPRAQEIARAVGALPSEGGELLAVLAARVFGDAHALDRSAGLGRATARFLALRSALESGHPPAALLGNWDDPVASADGWRDAWTSGGVACDAVSSQVLVLNLPLRGSASAVKLVAAAPGEPTWLSLRSLTGTLHVTAGEVFVCENPSIVEAAADLFGARSRPLVCTFGRPSQAALRLLDAVSASGAQLRVRADDDDTGRDIVSGILAAHPQACVWRMDHAGAVYEEELVTQLLADLAPPAAP